jgi:orsellinic acid C2-O-methyltransferase
VQAEVPALARLLRALSTLDVIEEVQPGSFALGPLGHLLRRDHAQGLRHWALLNGGPLWQRWSTLCSKVRQGREAEGTEITDDRFGKLEGDEHEATLFHGAMLELSRRVGSSLAEALDLQPGALVVDIGGGSGELLSTVLRQHPGACGLLFDQSHALSHAPPVLQRHGVSGRCRLQAGSFFDFVPADGDVYLMKSILHDWDDSRAARLLVRCCEALRSGVPLVVVERPMPERLAATPEHRALARSDLNMLVGPGGRERHLREYEALFARAGLVLRSVDALAAGFSAMRVVRA